MESFGKKEKLLPGEFDKHGIISEHIPKIVCIGCDRIVLATLEKCPTCRTVFLYPNLLIDSGYTIQEASDIEFERDIRSDNIRDLESFRMRHAPDSDELPNYPTEFEEKAWKYVQQNEFEKALDEFTKAIQLDPDSSRSFFGRGQCYFLLGGKDNKAIQDFNRYTKSHPEFEPKWDEMRRSRERFRMFHPTKEKTKEKEKTESWLSSLKTKCLKVIRGK
mgnify:CR=1 FL=1